MKNARPALIALTAALTLGITACGSPDDSDSADDTTSSASATSGASASSEDTAQESPSADASTEDTSGGGTGGASGGSDDGGLQAVLAAIKAAEKEADGTAYEVDDQDEDGTWEVDLAKGDRSIEVDVAEDGTARTDDDDDLDDDDRDGIKAAKITVGDAIEAALEEVDGAFDDVELEEEGGTHFWEVTIDSTGGDDVEVRVDVTDGTATLEQDDDNDDD